jgi:hypothetical protein
MAGIPATGGDGTGYGAMRRSGRCKSAPSEQKSLPSHRPRPATTMAQIGETAAGMGLARLVLSHNMARALDRQDEGLAAITDSVIESHRAVPMRSRWSRRRLNRWP